MKNCTFVKNVKRFPDLRCAFMVGVRGVFMQPYLHLRFFYGCTSFPMHISKGMSSEFYTTLSELCAQKRI